jgi:uncharacterized protein YjeT (DUF2065 family)
MQIAAARGTVEATSPKGKNVYAWRALSSHADPEVRRAGTQLASAGIVLCVASAAVAAAGAPSDAAFGRGLLVVGLPIAAGLYAMRWSATRRFGLALLILGVAIPND